MNFARIIASTDPDRHAKLAARLEAFAAAYAETGDDAAAAQRLGITITMGESLLRKLKVEGRA